MNNDVLYNQIMRKVSKVVMKAINEADYDEFYEKDIQNEPIRYAKGNRSNSLKKEFIKFLIMKFAELAQQCVKKGAINAEDTVGNVIKTLSDNARFSVIKVARMI